MNTETEYEKKVLEQYWRPGSDHADRRRLFSTLFKGYAQQDYDGISEAIDRLYGKEILLHKSNCIELNFEKIKQMDIDMLELPNRPMNDLISGIEMYLQKAGLYFRIFGRIKSPASIAEKIKRKGYCKTGGHMQDLIGIRIALYFSDDVSH